MPTTANTTPAIEAKPFYKSRTVWGVVLALISFWAQQLGMSLDGIVTHLQDVWNSLAGILLAIGIRDARMPLRFN